MSKTIFVAEYGDDENDGLTLKTAKKTYQGALDACDDTPAEVFVRVPKETPLVPAQVIGFQCKDCDEPMVWDEHYTYRCPVCLKSTNSPHETKILPSWVGLIYHSPTPEEPRP